MIDPLAVQEFLALDRIAVVGASADPKRFGNTIYRELRGHGHEVVAVNPKAATVEGDPCYPTLDAIPEPVDGVIVMVPPQPALVVLRSCADLGITRVWLFKGLGAPGAVSDEVLALCDDLGLEVIAGACPMMFLEPVGGFHSFHRALRHLKHSVAKVPRRAAS
jgi:hypothetical protein